jgi:hypothetical protein
MVESVEVEIGHQFSFYIVNCFIQTLQELVEIFLVQKNLVPVVAIFIEALTAFCNGQEIIIATGRPYIEEIGPSFTGFDALAVHAVHLLVGMLVRHSS